MNGEGEECERNFVIVWRSIIFLVLLQCTNTLYNMQMKLDTLSLWGASCCVTYICYINILRKNYTYVIRKRNFQKFFGRVKKLLSCVCGSHMYSFCVVCLYRN
jgi:hypothetical protein